MFRIDKQSKAKFLVVLLFANFFTFLLQEPSFAAETPQITTQPASANPALNGSVTLSVVASVNDGGTLSYQWLFRTTTTGTATNLSDTNTATNRISGTNSSTLTIDSVTAANSGLYSVRVTNTLTGVSASNTSNEAVVFVLLANEDFRGSSLSNPTDWVMTYRSQSGNNYSYAPCLTAASSSQIRVNSTDSQTVSTSSISGCQYPSTGGSGQGGESIASTDTNTVGQGVLRLTPSVNNQSAFVLYDRSLATTNGLDISFNVAMWGATVLSAEGSPRSGKFAADGLTFFLKDGLDTNTDAGYAGGSLGYSTNRSTHGVQAALFGIGLDGYGNYAGRAFGGNACFDTTNMNTGTYQSSIIRNGVTQTTTETYTAAWYGSGREGNSAGTYPSGTQNRGNQLVVRGPVGTSRTEGYCPISLNADGSAVQTPPIVTLSETSSATSVADGIWTSRNAANSRLVRVVIDGNSAATPTIRIFVDGILRLNINAPQQYKLSSTFKFGFTASTGGANQKIDIWATRVNTFTGVTAPDPPENVTVAQGSSNGTIDVSWTHSGLWGIGEAATGTRSFVATLYNSTGTTALNFSCTSSSTSGTPSNSCSIQNVPAGTYTVRVIATNRSGLSSTNSAISSTITSNGDTVITSCTGAGAIQNGSFEDLSGNQSYISGNFPLGWRTTALASVDTTTATPKAKIETWSGRSESASAVNISAPANSFSYQGSVLAEIAADNAGDSSTAVRQGLYQDVATISGSRIFWSYWHHFRSGGPNSDPQVAVFRAGPTPTGRPAGNIWTASEQANPFGDTATATTTVYDTVTSTDPWLQSSGTFIATSSSTRFLFQNHTSPASSYGNLIDDVRFTVYRACPITVRVVAGRQASFTVRNIEQNSSNFQYYAPRGAQISSVFDVGAGLTLSVSNTANTSSTFTINSSTTGTKTASYRVSYQVNGAGTTYTTSSTLTVEVVGEITARSPSSVPFDPTLQSKSLPGIRFGTATRGYVCYDQVANAAGASIDPPTVSLSRRNILSGVTNVQTGTTVIDSGTVTLLSSQAALLQITSNAGKLGIGGSKFIRVRASSIDNTDGSAPSCANGISFVIEFRRIKITQTRTFTVPQKNGKQT